MVRVQGRRRGLRLHPYEGETAPEYADFQDEGKYSWLKSPTLYGKPMQVGPLARVLTMLAADTSRPRSTPPRRWRACPRSPASRSGSTRCTPPSAATPRAVSCAVQVDRLARQWDLLLANMAKGDLDTFNAPASARRAARHGLPRGTARNPVALGGDRGRQDPQLPVRGADDLERRPAQRARRSPAPTRPALVDTPVAVPEQPLEVLRTVHSFDPCLACAVHVLDTEQAEVVRVKAA